MARSPKTASQKPTPSLPVTDLEDLQFELGRLETYAFAALEALDHLPYISASKDCDATRRLSNLVVLVADEAAATLANVNRIVGEYRRHLALDPLRK